MPACAVITCKNNSSSTSLLPERVTYHRFPADEETKKKWISFSERPKNWWPTVNNTICSVHFDVNCFVPLLKIRRLFNWAIPTLKKASTEVVKVKREPDETSTFKRNRKSSETSTEVVKVKREPDETSTFKRNKKSSEASTEVVKVKREPDETSTFKRKGKSSVASTRNSIIKKCKLECNDNDEVLTKVTLTEVPIECDFSTSVAPKCDCKSNGSKEDSAPIKMMRAKITQQKTKIKTLQMANRRYHKKISDLQDDLNEFKGNILKCLNQSNTLEDARTAVKHCLKESKVPQSTKEFPAAIRSFSIKLLHSSPKAYDQIRKNFYSCLPHLWTVKKWCKPVQSQPGFTKESLEAIKEKVGSVNKKFVCNLVMDEMAIQHRVETDGVNQYGYVTILNSVHLSDKTPKAKKALVYLVTAINGSWKAPVGYFFVDGLSAEQLANLTMECLTLVYSTGVQVSSLTFDDEASNMAMVKQLGCRFDEYSWKTCFSHPVTKEPVYIFPDPSHMLKSVRKALEANGVLQDSKGRQIKWWPLKFLHGIQDRSGLQLANKLSVDHILFKSDKTKVRLASQTFSNSVADALLHCANNLKFNQLENIEGTVEFWRNINNLFDILNSRKLKQRHYQQPLNESNKEVILQTLNVIEEYVYYINSLKLPNGALAIDSSKNMGFLGFLICITSLKRMYFDLVEEKALLNCLPTYKLSQEHIDAFFRKIRAHCGSKSNPTPTPRQFQDIYRRLLIKMELK